MKLISWVMTIVKSCRWLLLEQLSATVVNRKSRWPPAFPRVNTVFTGTLLVAMATHAAYSRSRWGLFFFGDIDLLHALIPDFSSFSLSIKWELAFNDLNSL